LVAPQPSTPTHRGSPARGIALAVTLAAGLASGAGCRSITARDAHLRNALRDYGERAEARGSADVRGVWPLARADPDAAMAEAERLYRVGLTQQGREPLAAMNSYRDAAVLAALALGEPGAEGRPLALEVHNRAVARLVRLAGSRRVERRASWRDVLVLANIDVVGASPFLDPARFADLTPTADLEVSGLDNYYRNDGLGVPLVAHRVAGSEVSPVPSEHFYPKDLQVAATALMTPGGGLADGSWRQARPKLTLVDPFGDRAVAVGGNALPLATDRSAALTRQLTDPKIALLEFTGLFRSDFRRKGVEAGLYMLRPYRPGKVPVVLVHGIDSSPRAFVQTINELENDPQVAPYYQFWVFMYPSGQPVLDSAAELREALIKARDTFDPGHGEPAMGRQVLVGHSMGGLVIKMMAQDSGLAVWDALINVPNDRFQATPKVRRDLERAMVFEHLPFVRREVFIATPHRGSPIANQLFGRVVGSLVKGPADLASDAAEVAKRYGKEVFGQGPTWTTLTAVGNLRTNSPVLAALNRLPIHPDTPHHSIIPMIGDLRTDGVVQYSSSHLDGVQSELIVPGTHSSEGKPEVTRELRRILQEHLAQARAEGAQPDADAAGPYGEPTPAQPAVTPPEP